MEPNTNPSDPLHGGSVPSVNDPNNINNVNKNSTSNLITPVPVVINPNSSPPSPLTSSSTKPTIVTAQPQPVTTPTTALPNTHPLLGVPIGGQTGTSQPSTGANTFKSASAGKGKGSKKKLLLGGLTALAIILGSTGYVFGFYIPNKPANVFQTGLDRSGTNLIKLVDKFTEKDRLEKIQNTEITATADATGEGSTFNGKFDVKLSKSKSDGNLDISIKQPDKPEETLKIKFLSDLPDGKKYPNLYFQITGLKGLGLDTLSPGVSNYEGKWIAVESDYLESSLGLDATAPKNKENITSEEIASLVRTITSTTDEYLLTSDKNKAVLENKAFIGKEKSDGINTYHYQVGINKDHAKDLCKTLSERVLSHATYKKLFDLDDSDVQEQKKNIDKDCDDSVKSIKDDTTLDLWIDAKYKLIQKLRIYDEKDKGIYTDLGQTYTGGDKISFFVAYHTEATKTDAKFTVDVDTKAFTSKGTFTWKQTQDTAIDAKIIFEAKPYAGEVKAEKPVGAIPIQQILGNFGYDSPSDTPAVAPPPPSSSTTTVQSRAKDTERQTDIKALHAQIEAYYAQYGSYPSLANLNDSIWRSKNMRGLDSETLKDPDGVAPILATKPSVKQYGYLPAECNGGGTECQDYTLIAILSTGSLFTKKSLN